MRQRLLSSACAVAIASWTGATSAQDIDPGDAVPAAYVLPYGFDPVLNLRTYFLESKNGTV